MKFKLDRTELGFLKAIVLYNPDIKHLQDAALVETLREKVYASLEAYGKWLTIVFFVNFSS